MYRNDRLPGCFVGLLAVAVAVACASTPQEIARRANHTAAIAVDASDAVFAPVYTARAREALEASTTIEGYRAAVREINGIQAALDTAREAVELAEHLVDIWDQGGASDWARRFACVVGALAHVHDVLAAAGLSIPAALTDAIELAQGVVSPEQCPPAGGA